MTVYVVENVVSESTPDITETIANTIVYMNQEMPSYCPIPLEETVVGFTDNLIKEVGDMVYEADPQRVLDHMIDLILFPEFREETLRDIRHQEGFGTVARRYHLFCGRLQPMNIWYPCIGEVSDEIQAKREAKALEKTFCKK
jgi:hypothetical protein